MDYMVKANGGSDTFYDTYEGNEIQRKYVLGGVDMNVDLVEKKCEKNEFE